MLKKKVINPKFAKWLMPVKVYPQDEIVSTPWHLKLDKCTYIPDYMHETESMGMVMCGEYERLWHLGREKWVKQLDKPPKSQMKDIGKMNKVRERIKQENLEAKKRIAEWKKERAILLAEKERLEKIKEEKKREAKEKERKCAERNKIFNKPKKEKEIPVPVEKEEIIDKKVESCPEGWQKVELTLKCECAEDENEPEEEEQLKKPLSPSCKLVKKKPVPRRICV